MKILLCEPGKLAYEKDIPHTLETMQELVGGLITAVYPYEEPVAVVCNDEGLLLGLPLNRKLDDYTIIAGTFFVCGLGVENFTDLSPELMKKFKEKLLYPHMIFQAGSEMIAVPYNPEEGGN